MKVSKFNYDNAATNLVRILGNHPEYTTIYTSCDHVSKNGMSRNIKVFVVRHNDIFCVGHGRVSGCGMDMGYHVVETIFSLAYPNAKEEKFEFNHRWL